jgi:hypothetical protein
MNLQNISLWVGAMGSMTISLGTLSAPIAPTISESRPEEGAIAQTMGEPMETP